MRKAFDSIKARVSKQPAAGGAGEKGGKGAPAGKPAKGEVVVAVEVSKAD